MISTIPAHFPPNLAVIIHGSFTYPSISTFKPFKSTAKSAKPCRGHAARALNDEPKSTRDGVSSPEIESLEARAGVGRRARRSANERFDGQPEANPKPNAKKDWDSMTLSEKLLEIYVGEKGYVQRNYNLTM